MLVSYQFVTIAYQSITVKNFGLGGFYRYPFHPWVGTVSRLKMSTQEINNTKLGNIGLENSSKQSVQSNVQ